MSWISSILKAIWAAIKKIIKIIVDFVKEFWWVILIVVMIWFAPAILMALPAGTPAFITTGVSWIATNVTPMLVSAGSWVTSNGSALFDSASAAWKTAGLSTKAMLVAGTVAALAPEEFTQAVTDTVGFVADIASDVITAAASGTGLTTIFGLGLLAFGFYRLVLKKAPPVAAASGTPPVVIANKRDDENDKRS